MSNPISKICAILKDFYSHQSKSITQLFNESGYVEKPELVTKESLIEHLTTNPNLVKEWENYSSDKRVGQGWYFIKDKSQWTVGYSSVPSQERRQTFASAFEACAEFIIHELREWAEHVTRS